MDNSFQTVTSQFVRRSVRGNGSNYLIVFIVGFLSPGLAWLTFKWYTAKVLKSITIQSDIPMAYPPQRTVPNIPPRHLDHTIVVQDARMLETQVNK